MQVVTALTLVGVKSKRVNRKMKNNLSRLYFNKKKFIFNAQALLKTCIILFIRVQSPGTTFPLGTWLEILVGKVVGKGGIKNNRSHPRLVGLITCIWKVHWISHVDYYVRSICYFFNCASCYPFYFERIFCRKISKFQLLVGSFKISKFYKFFKFYEIFETKKITLHI